MERLVASLFLLAPLAVGQTPVALDPSSAVLARFGAGDGPSIEGDTIHVLDAHRTAGQSNVVAFGVPVEGAFEELELAFRMVLEAGGEGAGAALLPTARYGRAGPGPFAAAWEGPDLAGALAVGFDVRNPPEKDPFNANGNVQGLPEREISIHFDGRELVKRLAPVEFRGQPTDVRIAVAHEAGGGRVTVALGPVVVFDGHFVPGLEPAEVRPAFGARTAADAPTACDVSAVSLAAWRPAERRRGPIEIEVFHRARLTASRGLATAEVELPGPDVGVARILLAIELPRPAWGWDPWDRCGAVYAWAGDERFEIARFITPYLRQTRWVVDVTDFQSILRGTTKMGVHVGTIYDDKGFDASVSLAYHRGRPRREAHRVVNLWSGWATHGADLERPFGEFFADRTVALDERVVAARVRVMVTGHSQVGEFTPAGRTLTVGEASFENVLWKTDCYLNPVRPQSGTWKYPRAGWAPGDIVEPWIVDVTGAVEAGAEATLSYRPHAYDFGPARPHVKDGDIHAARHWVESQLVLERDVPPTRWRLDPALVVTQVVDGSQAAAAGIRPGDGILSYAGRDVFSVAGLQRAKEERMKREGAAGEPVALVLARDGVAIEVEIAPGPIGVHLAER